MKRWYIVVIVTILFGAATFTITRFVMTPVYSARGMIFVNNANSSNVVISPDSNVSYSDLVASQRLATTYIEILKSETFMLGVSRKSGLNIPASQMRSLISITSKNDTEILEIRAVHANPEMAANIVEKFLEHSRTELPKVFKAGSVEIIDHATVPLSPSGPNAVKNTALGIILGMMLSCLLVILFDLLDNTVKDQEDLASRYKFPVLGMIPTIISSKEVSTDNT